MATNDRAYYERTANKTKDVNLPGRIRRGGRRF